MAHPFFFSSYCFTFDSPYSLVPPSTYTKHPNTVLGRMCCALFASPLEVISTILGETDAWRVSKSLDVGFVNTRS